MKRTIPSLNESCFAYQMSRYMGGVIVHQGKYAGIFYLTVPLLINQIRWMPRQHPAPSYELSSMLLIQQLNRPFLWSSILELGNPYVDFWHRNLSGFFRLLPEILRGDPICETGELQFGETICVQYFPKCDHLLQPLLHLYSITLDNPFLLSIIPHPN